MSNNKTNNTHSVDKDHPALAMQPGSLAGRKRNRARSNSYESAYDVYRQ
ncbi:MAG: hypothetical protein ABIU06_20340 [Anaerolineales bacterium]